MMVATSDMLIRRASGFLITPDDGRRNNRRVIQIEDAPPARLLMRFTYVPPRFVSPLFLSLSLSLPSCCRVSVCLPFDGWAGVKSFCQNRESKPGCRERCREPEATGTPSLCFLFFDSASVHGNRELPSTGEIGFHAFRCVLKLQAGALISIRSRE